MLNQLALHFWEAATGRALSGVLSEITGISDRTLRKRSGILRKSSIAKAREHSIFALQRRLAKFGLSEREIKSWISKYPSAKQPGALYAAIVYETQYPGVLEFPHTIKFAAKIDRLSTQLFTAREQDDFHKFKHILLGTRILNRTSFENDFRVINSNDERTVFENRRSAKDWSALGIPIRVLSTNILFSLLAHWDVELCSKYFTSFQARSCFAMLLPRLDPAVGAITATESSRRRDMFWLPVRRLIDFIACMGGFARDGTWPSKVFRVHQLARDAGEPEQNLVNWRDGTKAFTWSDFDRMWRKLCPDRNGPDGPPCELAPWPLFVAATLWQEALVSVSTANKKRSIVLCACCDSSSG